MHLSRLPIPSSELTIKSPGAPISVAIAAPNEAMNLPGVIHRMPSYLNEVVIAGRRSRGHTVDAARAVRVDVVAADGHRKGVLPRLSTPEYVAGALGSTPENCAVQGRSSRYRHRQDFTD